MDRKDIDRTALELHARYRGRIQTAPMFPVSGIGDFPYGDIPGVTAIFLAIHEDAGKKGLSEETILPAMDDFNLFEVAALAMACQAMKEGFHRLTLDDGALRAKIRKRRAVAGDFFYEAGVPGVS